MADLSPDAQAVRDAANLRHGCTPSAIAAGALLAVADQLLIRPDVERSEYSTLMRLLDRKFRAIAAELEGLDG